MAIPQDIREQIVRGKLASEIDRLVQMEEVELLVVARIAKEVAEDYLRLAH